MDPIDLYYDQFGECGEFQWQGSVSYPVYGHTSLAEKACVDVFDERASFCKVYHVVHDGLVVVSKQPERGSPSLRLWNNPELGKLGVRASYMMEADFELPDGSTTKYAFTGFNVAPGVGMTAGHGVDEWDGLDYKGKLSRVQGCVGPYIPPGLFRVSGFVCSPLWKANSMSHYVNNLPTKGVDLAIFSTNSAANNEFLLPCSYDFMERQFPDKEVAVYSYPHVSTFMRDAELQLKDGVPPSTPRNDIWKAYKSTMELRAKKLNLTATKSELYSMLSDTFSGFSTGHQVASVGQILSNSDAALGGCYSTLGGSSGAPICPISLRGYFLGIQIAAGVDSAANIATSTDNASFVEYYKTHVLPRLPLSSSPVWNSIDLHPFEDWLATHNISWERQESGAASSPMTPVESIVSAWNSGVN